MFEKKLSFHSPFTASTVSQAEGPALLLQFILSELLKSEDRLSYASPPQLAPFDWSWKQGSAHKLREHGSLLPFAFPNLIVEGELFLKNFHLPCSELLLFLEPFIFACQTNENLLYFLLKHQKTPSIRLMLDKICPEGLEKLKMEIILQYQKRGFYPSKWIA